MQSAVSTSAFWRVDMKQTRILRRAHPIAFGIVLGAMLSESALAEDFAFGKFPQQTGEAIYKGVCQGCHMPDAKGAVGAGAYPALANNPKLQDAGYPVFLVVNGHKAMPPFGDSFNNQQVANVVNYIRTHFGNRYTDMVKPSDVQIVRPAAPNAAPKKNMHD
jgi:mono/diheme cytochrome c family protein